MTKFSDKGAIVYENRTQAIATLSQGGVLVIGTKLAITDEFRMLKSEISCLLIGVTNGELRGLQLWLANGELSVTEIDEAIEANGPLSRQDRLRKERSMRAVFYVGSMDPATSITASEMYLVGGASDGPDKVRMILKPRWTFGKTNGWNWVLRNMGPAPTTGASARIEAKSFGVWLD